MKIPAFTATTLTTALQRQFKQQDAAGSAEESPQAKRWREMRESLQQLQAMSDPKRTAREDKERRAALLKQRLESLKMLLMHASPQQAKALLSELKSIAHELGALAKESSGDASTPTVQAAAGAGDTATAATGSAEAAASAAAEADVSEDSPPADTASADVPAGEDGSTTSQAGTDEASDERADETSQQREHLQPGNRKDDSLRDTLNELKRLLKEVTSLMKAKLAQADREARDELRRIEHESEQIDIGEATTPSVDGNLYSNPGSALSGGFGLDAGSAVTGTSVSTSA